MLSEAADDSAAVGVVDLTEALELDNFSFEWLLWLLFGDAVDGGDLRMCWELALCVDSLRSMFAACCVTVDPLPLMWWLSWCWWWWAAVIGLFCAFIRLATRRSSGASWCWLLLLLSFKHDSYGLKLDLTTSWGDPFDAGDDLSRRWLFSMFAMSLGLGASEPIALHVWASRANGLDFESNCKEREVRKN